jgi:hypothetical protein
MAHPCPRIARLGQNLSHQQRRSRPGCTVASAEWLCWLFFLVEFIQLLMDSPELFHQLLVFLDEALVCALQVLQLRVKALLLLLVSHFAGIVPGRLLVVEE